MKHLLILPLLISLSACGGSNKTAPIEIIEPDPIILPVINPAIVSLAKLKPATSTELKSSLTNGLYRDSSNLTRLEVAVPAAPALADGATNDSGNFSVTVTAETGVDELDIVKYNGNYLYVLDHNYDTGVIPKTIAPPILAKSANTIRIYERQSDNSLSAINTIEENQDQEGYIFTQGLYNYGTDVISIGTSSTYGYWALDSFRAPSSQQFFFNIYDLSSPAQPTLTQKMSVDGYLLDSRRIDQYLILVSSFTPTIPQINLSAATDAERKANLTLLEGTTLDDFLPKFTLNDQAPQNLVDPDNCYIPNDAASLDGHAGIVTITVVDMTNPSQTNSICVNGYYDGMYASKDAVILFGNSNQENTVLHHFNFTSPAFTYNGSALVPGFLGWNQPQLRLSILDTYLRVVSSQSTNDETDRLDHTLSIFDLESTNSELTLIGLLPNNVQTDEIGKPNEDIMAVRFYGTKAYVVSFERIDPFYVIDLTNPRNPLIVGELEMPGYSSYLHPIGNDYVLGIGQNVDPNRFIADSPVEQAIVEGAKVALFDVSGTPRIVNEYVFENAGTPVEFNYKALTYLPVSEFSHWFAMPMTSWNAPTDIEQNWTMSNRLELFDVDLLGNGAMTNKGRVAPDFSSLYYSGSYDDRAVIHGDSIYYVHGGRVWQSSWTSPETILGPF